MDIDLIRFLVREGNYRTTLEFEQRLAQRDVNLDKFAKSFIQAELYVRKKENAEAYQKPLYVDLSIWIQKAIRFLYLSN